MPQLSNVIIGSDVEIGACTCIDRGAFEPSAPRISGPCMVCDGPARVNELCGRCRAALSA